MTWKTLSSKPVYQNRYMTVTEDELETDNGDKVVYGIVRKEPFSVVIPWDGTKLLLVGQYRPSAEIFSWEFPMGHAELDSPLVAAQKELQEETGLIAHDLTQIASFYPALGTMNQLGYLYVATSWTLGERDLEPSEQGMQLKWVSLPDLTNLIADGTIKDGPTITALKYFELYLAKNHHE
ncbi:ADP-ribose pyrophosphatase [Candidatus Collierbacteria bacterium CG17_big_fil_post_rev_8_21_14_2_50_45_7]|uniref:ADP-ribose pyrophosphatase n=1 Tax=Candidatus Collierbacteria bacterium CG17_big_fil_post_rev_8_21_14_2_50_45_7 TaxID=1974536 RepID=A0A2M7FQ62_9BACT|nr:MAG: ADP-ribose pyrophosphatase [Candidatus Collierbacteria bacterium CG17_big_fil_post_rev_8_21_14_2_50_45_7]